MHRIERLRPSGFAQQFEAGTRRIGYNKTLLSKLLPDTPLEGWNLVFDPAVAGKLAKCGINLMDIGTASQMMDPAVIANISNATGYANANKDATPLLDPSVAGDPAVYPTADQQRRLFVQSELTSEQARAITRLWQNFKSQQ